MLLNENPHRINSRDHSKTVQTEAIKNIFLIEISLEFVANTNREENWIEKIIFNPKYINKIKTPWYLVELSQESCINCAKKKYENEKITLFLKLKSIIALKNMAKPIGANKYPIQPIQAGWWKANIKRDKKISA